jgi:hypothetical protein
MRPKARASASSSIGNASLNKANRCEVVEASSRVEDCVSAQARSSDEAPAPALAATAVVAELEPAPDAGDVGCGVPAAAAAAVLSPTHRSTARIFVRSLCRKENISLALDCREPLMLARVRTWLSRIRDDTWARAAAPVEANDEEDAPSVTERLLLGRCCCLWLAARPAATAVAGLGGLKGASIVAAE